MCVCEYVYAYVLKIYMDICIFFLKKPVDFSDDLSKIVGFSKYCRFCLILMKFMFISILKGPTLDKYPEQLSKYSRHQEFQFELS